MNSGMHLHCVAISILTVIVIVIVILLGPYLRKGRLRVRAELVDYGL